MPPLFPRVAFRWKPGQTLPIDSVCESSLGHARGEDDTVTVICHSLVPGYCPARLKVASAVAQSDVWLPMLNGRLAS